MPHTIGLRREDKNKWERRAPLTPDQVAGLIQEYGLEFIIQPSPIRAFSDEAYIAAGAKVQENLAPAQVILAVKEIPAELLEPGKTYLFFSHTIKGQPHNMPLLQRLLDLNCQLLDYECVTNAQDRRLIFFGHHAGLAGMIDTLHVLGQRLAWEGFDTPLAELQLTHHYANLDKAKQAVQQVGRQIAENGLPLELVPLVIGVAGYGNVSQGAQTILELLPLRRISPGQLLNLDQPGQAERNVIYAVVFKEQDTVEPVEPDHEFDLQQFFDQPELYQSKFDRYLPRLSALVNCIYWDTPYPRLLTKAAARRLYQGQEQPRLRVIGDISCDIEGAIEPTLKATNLDEPAFVWDPTQDVTRDGVAGTGPVIMAVDNLPCELPTESSTAFGEALLPFLPALATCDFSAPFESCALPPELKRAVIVYHGRLTPTYAYLTEFLPGD